jgi:hypothetical protein
MGCDDVVVLPRSMLLTSSTSAWPRSSKIREMGAIFHTWR